MITRAFFVLLHRDPAMNLTRKDVENIAHLARLAINEDELATYVSNLSKIVTFVAQLDAADTSKVEPMAHPLSGQTQRLRPDEVTEHDQRERFQKNAPKVEAGLYLVPKVIE
jgi:aspartyl-tRNA(Asn)/glutamyl-tRNA(Gln) amidotransferase subunit C